ncbi:putative inorganic phosphate cotransporter isoform X1 [Anoplophora glabripennis]|uniref:putative inorganic phosphate cotransporter isoform X1 n=2 Tax=Anoplophora glabripennis TaxID=217634 RepID=UPI000C75C4F4|nr:putative inorganic phosphate cotransporter isoform X1 [Anoplophora glabripennis]
MTEEINGDAVQKPNRCFGIRHVQCAFLSVIIIAVSGMRNSLSVAVIAMVSTNPPNKNIPTYPEWADEKNVILSSFFWGYIVFQSVAGMIAKKYGAKYLLGIGMFVNSVFCLIMPYFGSQFGYQGVIVCRVIQGLTQGPLLPCCHNLLSKWLPLQERGKMGNFVYACFPLGTVISLPLAGVISSSAAGWPTVFYLYGGISLVWSILWLIFGSNSPSTDRFISEDEKMYIQTGTATDEEKSIATPWKAIFTSGPYYAIIICHCGTSLGDYTMMSETPSYMEKIMDFDLASNSFLCALPSLGQYVVGNLLGQITSRLIEKGVLSVGAARKLSNSLATFVPALFLFLMVFLGPDQSALTLVSLIVGVGMLGAIYSGYLINHMDISPVHAGTLMGIGNSLGNIFGFVAPLSVDAISSISGYNETLKELWNIVFSVSGIVLVATGISYIILGSGEEQPWSRVEDRTISKVRKGDPLRKLSTISFL